jgi:hypothetical protein
MTWLGGKNYNLDRFTLLSSTTTTTPTHHADRTGGRQFLPLGNLTVETLTSINLPAGGIPPPWQHPDPTDRYALSPTPTRPELT